MVVIANLAAMFLSALSAACERAGIANSSFKRKQLGLGMTMYAGDN